MLLQESPFDFAATGWIYEIKFDGYRLMALVDRGQIELRTRGGADATDCFPETRAALASLAGGSHVLDGEICVLDSLGRSDFDVLQERARIRRWYRGAPAVAYMAFDLLVENGKELTAVPLEGRKLRLANVLNPDPLGVVALDHFKDGKQLFDEAVRPLQRKIKRDQSTPPQRYRRKKHI